MRVYRNLSLPALILIGACTALVVAGTSHDAKRRLLITPQRDGQYPHLHNVWRLTDRIYSGSEPHGEQGFAELAVLGIDTIVSVDGARPNIEAARERGLRYVHIPIGYDGIPTDAGQALARVVRDAVISGDQVYIHCHHGKHRGPAAAAVACIAAGAADHAAALEILAKAGASKDYAGLWRDVAAYQPPPADAELPPLVEVAQVDSLAVAMAELDRRFDNLELCEQAKWQAPADHPDLAPAQEALMIKESLHEAARNLADGYDEKFIQWLRQSETIAATLEQQLKSGDAASASQTFTALESACQKCHVEYRN